VVAKLERGAKVADVGCGHGASSVILAQTYPKTQVFGFDSHDASIETARQRAQQSGVAEQAEFTVASIRNGSVIANRFPPNWVPT
jgi:trans-aconitate methyltransferase